MYIPAAFREPDTERLHEFIHSHGFATVTTHNVRGLVASHVPVLLDPQRGEFGTLFGHFAKANDQVADIESDALVIFAGPHTYISPTWYETPNTVPTWNYVAVHAYGRLQPVDDREVLSRILTATVEKYEGSRAAPWPFDSETDFHQKLIDGIVGFEIKITRLEGKWKLNQNHPTERRQRVITALLAQGGTDQLEIAELMKANIADDARS